MKTSRYTEAQIIAILRQGEGGVPVAELCREHGMGNASFYKWRAKRAIVAPLVRAQWRVRYACVLDQPDEGHGMRRIRKQSGGLFSR